MPEDPAGWSALVTSSSRHIRIPALTLLLGVLGCGTGFPPPSTLPEELRECTEDADCEIVAFDCCGCVYRVVASDLKDEALLKYGEACSDLLTDDCSDTLCVPSQVVCDEGLCQAQ